MYPPHNAFPQAESDTKPGRPPSARPAALSAERRSTSDFSDPPPSWRARPPLESTTYSIVPGALERSTSTPRPRTKRPSAPSKSTDAKEKDALSPVQCREIDAVYASLTTLSHYEILGVPRDVEPLALHAAYEGLASAFHADRFGRKVLGPFRRKLEVIVECVNEAYATLSAPDLRATYDERLAKHEG
jgi:hypothetical protein